MTRGQLPPHVSTGGPDVNVHELVEETHPHVVELVAAQVSPAGHGPPQKPDPSGTPQTGIVVVVVEVVTVVLVLVVGAAAGAQRSGGAPGTTVRLPNWSATATGAFAVRGQWSA